MNLIFVLGDQLSRGLEALKRGDPSRDIVLMCEVDGEATAVKHHKKKIAFLFSAMRHFAEELRQDGFKVDYIKIGDPSNTHAFSSELERAIIKHNPDEVHLTEPSEHRVRELVKGWQAKFKTPIIQYEDRRYLCSKSRFAAWAEGRKELRMEYFYRDMRRHYGVLMEGDKPIGGQWNFDKDNRKPAKTGLSIPQPFRQDPDEITKTVMNLVSDRYADHFGDIDPFHYAVTRSGALAALDHFIKERLPKFGDYQDAMLSGEPWMYHSHISLYLNCGLLGPLECIERAEQAFHDKRAPINAVEGFIRQILGWREYVKGLYDLKMPAYKDENYLNAQRSLPAFYWTADTRMNCLRQCVSETKANAYAHHIQRLMVLGNFALLAGCHPDEVNEWYHIVYADAFEWVELPNVSGMVLFADGGVLASKPYAASGAYINRMSNYCDNCSYSVSKKNGPKACPFNYLYWEFLSRNGDKLSQNPRLGMPYRNLSRMSSEKREAVAEDARRFFKALENDEKV